MKVKNTDMSERISESGIINQDGKLKMPMDRLNDFFQKHKGKRVIVQMEAVEKGTSMAQLAYWYKYIVPTVQKGLKEMGERKNVRQVDIWLREKYGEFDENEKLVEPIGMSRDSFADMIDAVKQMAAEYLGVYIEDSKTI